LWKQRNVIVGVSRDYPSSNDEVMDSHDAAVLLTDIKIASYYKVLRQV
jgi:hypothetical protein